MSSVLKLEVTMADETEPEHDRYGGEREGGHEEAGHRGQLERHVRGGGCARASAGGHRARAAQSCSRPRASACRRWWSARRSRRVELARRP